MIRTGTMEGTGGCTRRETLTVLAAIAGVPMLPAAASPLALPPDLARICVAATESPVASRLGAAAAEGCTLSELAASLVARLGPDASADWRAALVQCGRRDIAAGDRVDVLGRPLMRTEAEVLALGVLVRGTA